MVVMGTKGVFPRCRSRHHVLRIPLEIATLLLVRRAKVEIAAAEIAVADDVVDDEVEGPFLLACVAVGQVLGVDHIPADEEPCSCEQLAFRRLADIQSNIFRETLLKQEHLIG